MVIFIGHLYYIRFYMRKQKGTGPNLGLLEMKHADVWRGGRRDKHEDPYRATSK
jgi:hypothetical protein